MFFAILFGENTESAGPLLNLLELLSVENIYKLQVLKFSHKWHKKQLPSIFEQHFRYASDVHKYNTRYASKANFYKPRYRTNIGKQTTKAMAIDIWQHLPVELKNASSYNFSKKVKKYLLTKQFHSQ